MYALGYYGRLGIDFGKIASPSDYFMLGFSSSPAGLFALLGSLLALIYVDSELRASHRSDLTKSIFRPVFFILIAYVVYWGGTFMANRLEAGASWACGTSVKVPGVKMNGGVTSDMEGCLIGEVGGRMILYQQNEQKLFVIDDDHSAIEFIRRQTGSNNEPGDGPTPTPTSTPGATQLGDPGTTANSAATPESPHLSDPAPTTATPSAKSLPQ